MNEKRWRRGASIPIHPPASPPFPRMEEIAFIVLPIYTSRQVVIPSGDETCRVFSYIIVAFTNLYTESYRLGREREGKLSANLPDRVIYIYFSLLSFSFFLIPSLFTRETHFPLSSSNDRVGKLVIFRSSQFRPSFEMCWLMKKRGHR